MLAHAPCIVAAGIQPAELLCQPQHSAQPQGQAVAAPMSGSAATMPPAHDMQSCPASHQAVPGNQQGQGLSSTETQVLPQCCMHTGCRAALPAPTHAAPRCCSTPLSSWRPNCLGRLRCVHVGRLLVVHRWGLAPTGDLLRQCLANRCPGLVNPARSRMGLRLLTPP